MKKLGLLIVIVFFGFLLASCKDTTTPIVEEPVEIAVTDVSLDQASVTIYKDTSITVVATVLPENATKKTLTWSSSDETVATVNQSGVITGIKAGTASITVKSVNLKEATIQVTVMEETLEAGYFLDVDFNDNLMPPSVKVSSSGGGSAEITDGILTMGTLGTGASNASVTFSEALSGTVVAETRVKVDSTAFTNVLFFYTSGINTTDIVASLAFENNAIKYHSGVGWTNVTSYETGRWYDVKMVLNIGDRELNPNKGNFDLFIDGVLIGKYSFRNGGDGYEDNIYRLEFGTSKANSSFSFDYIRVYNSEKPVLTLGESVASVDLDLDPTYEVTYSVTGQPTPTVSITSDTPTGYSVSGDVITFTAAGTYVFDVTASNGGGIDTKQLTITVSGDAIAPNIDLVESTALVQLNINPTYTLLYEVTAGNPEPTVTIEGTPATGYTREGDLITFTTAGTYMFDVTATNSAGSLTKQVTVTVMSSSEILTEDFSAPLSYAVTKTGTGDVTVADGIMNIQSQGDANVAFVNIPFGHVISRSFMVTTKVKVDNPAFSNALFFYSNNQNGTTDIAISVAFEAGNIRYHNGTTWVTITPYVEGQWYVISMVIDLEEAKFELIIDGQSMGSFGFRKPSLSNQITHLYLGSTKTGTNMSYDYIYANYLTAPSLTINEAEAMVNMDTDPVYEFDYTIANSVPEARVTITGNPSVGYTLNGNQVTFIATGEYVFTVSATNGVDIVSKDVTVTVTGNSSAALVNINEDKGFVIIDQDATYELLYTITQGDPEAVVAIEANHTTGFSLVGNQVTFTEAGLYEFTVSATNSVGTSSGVITVEVLDSIHFVENDFTESLPESYQVSTTGTGSIVASEGNLRIQSNGVSNAAQLKIPFGHTVKDDIIIETRYMSNSNAFSNVLFVYGNDSNSIADIVLAFAFENGNIKYHSGAGWTNITPFTVGTYYDIKLVLNIETAKFVAYINDVRFGEFSFRVAANKDAMTHLYIGSDKTGSDMNYEFIKVSYTEATQFTLSETEATIDMNVTSTYTLPLSTQVVYPEAVLTVTSEQTVGWSYQAGIITFTSAGVYTFVIQSFNYTGMVEETITITVLGSVVAPTLKEVEMTGFVDFNQTQSYTFVYTVAGNPAPVVTITSDATTGYTIAGDVVTFTEVGSYTFTITATNEAGSVVQEVVVDVLMVEAVDITVLETEASVNITANNQYVLDYLVSGNPVPTVSVTVDQITGYTLDEDLKSVYFFEPGAYVFTITAENDLDLVSKIITVTVLEEIVTDYFYQNEFTELPINITLTNDAMAVIENSTLKLTTGVSSKALVGIDFEAALSGIVAYETRVKVSTASFQNVALLYAGTANVIGIALENGFVRYHNGSSWTSTGHAYDYDQWIDIKFITEIGSGLFDLYVDGVLYEDLTVRTSGAAESNITVINNIGIDNRLGATMYFDYINVYNLDPQITLAQTAYQVSMSQSPSLSIDYTTYSAIPATFELVGLETTGYLISNNTITFDAVGDYTFEIIGQTAYMSVVKQFTVSVVSGDVAPEITLNETEATLDLSYLDHTYTLDYDLNIAIPEATLDISVLPNTNVTLSGDTLTFTATGTYTVTLTYANSAAQDIKTVTILVNDSGYIVNEAFDTLPSNMSTILEGTNTITVEQNVLDATGGVLKVSTGTVTGQKAFYKLPFGGTLSGKVVVESRIMVGSTAFSNALFLYANNENTTIVTALAFDGGYLRYHNGSTWKAIQAVSLDTWYEITMVLDTDAATFKLFVNGVQSTQLFDGTPMTDFVFRTPSSKLNITHFYNGSDKTNAALYYDYLRVYEGQIPTLTLTESAATVDMNTASTYDVLYTTSGTPAPILSITSEQAGYSVNGNIITFTGAGQYTFTVTASNALGSVSEVLTINVLGASVAPTLEITEMAVTLDLTESNTHTILYTIDGTPVPTIDITTLATTGFMLNNNVVTFTETGTYVFTVTATNEAGSISKDVTITVVELVPPTITVLESVGEVNLTLDNQYALDYTVVGQELPTITVSVDQISGFVIAEDNQSVQFTATGIYVFTILAENTKGTDTKTITVTVTEETLSSYIYQNEFDLLPDSAKLTLTNDGAAVIEDGAMKLSTTLSSRALFKDTFTSALQGTVVYETRFKVSSTVFQNIQFLYSGATTNVLGIAIQDNLVRYNDGTGWKVTAAPYVLNEWVTVKTVTSLGTGLFHLYVDGIYYGELSLRTKGAAELTVDNMNNIGIDNRTNSTMHIDYIRLYNLNPSVTLTQDIYSLSLSETNTLTPDFTVSSNIPTSTTLVGLEQTGYTVSGNTITFTTVGEYHFNVIAETAYSNETKSFVVTVVEGGVAPDITINEASSTVDISSLTTSYTLNYNLNVALPEASLSIDVYPQVGVTLLGDVATFTEAGVYTFTLTYANLNAQDVEVITVTVIETGFIINESFDTLPTNMTTTLAQQGAITVETGVVGADGGVLKVSTGSTTGQKAFFNLPFVGTLSGSIVVESRVKVGNTSFSNALFFYAPNNTTIVAAIAFDTGYLRYHNGSTWKAIQTVTVDTWYDLKLVMDVEAATFTLFVDGVQVTQLFDTTPMTNFAFRTPASKLSMDHFYNGSDKVNALMYYDYIKVYKQ